MVNPFPAVPAELCLEAVLWHLCQGVGRSPNCSALAKCPWATTAGDSSAGGVGGTAQCRVGHQFCVSCALPWQPLPSSLSPPCFLTPLFGFPSPRVPLLPLSPALSGSGSYINQTQLSANTSSEIQWGGGLDCQPRVLFVSSPG